MKIRKLIKELTTILTHIVESEDVINEKILGVHKDYRLSAKNFYRYLLLRTHDLRKYHDALSELGISSLRTAEGYVLSNLYNVVRNLKLLDGATSNDINIDEKLEFVGYQRSKKLLRKHANRLFNEERKKHFTEIMVTLPDEAAEDKAIIRDMVLNGMEIARINLSHGNIEMWERMVEYIHQIQRETNEKIKIYMDLSGPKIRTSTIEIYEKKGKIKGGIPVKVGEHIHLTKRETLGKKSEFGKTGEQIEKAEVGVLLPQIIDDAQMGDVILFDDGMIRAKVIGKNVDDIEIVITDCYKSKLSSHKGINLPNTKLQLPALTESDHENLPFVCKHADILGYSFVRTGADVRKLYQELEKNDAGDIGVVFKIENQEAFENLPDILFEGMARNKIGVMIARGDLAIEIGFERISEVQNQILWLCEAAHIPVIWATQVLENLAKTGIPTRAEISDAALGAQAECVMLNKGPHINEAIRVLKDILIRMSGHSFKKKNALRVLNVAKQYLDRTLVLVLLALFAGCQPKIEQETFQKPNIIVILADDFGVGDIQAHYPDNKIPTPYLDRLVNEGMSFTDAHSGSAVCSPTRYGLLTGRYAWRTPLQEWVLACYEPPLIKPETTTLPEMLKEQGYATACIGKWHLGWNWQGEQESVRIEKRNGLDDYTWDYTKPITGGPTEHGFDYYFGTHVPNFPPFTFIENDRVVEQPTSSYQYQENPAHVVMPRGFEGSPMAPDWKFEEILPELTRRAVDYIHAQSQSEQPFFLYFSMTSPHEPVVPGKQFAGKSGIAPIADFVMETDWSAGQLVDAVEQAGISDNTMIIFTADNGHSHYTGWEELVAAGHMPSGPYRGHKGDIWEGGHRVPLVVKWPGKVAPGTNSNQLTCLTDIYETCYQLMTGQVTPENQGEDSFSFLDILLNESTTSGRQNIVNHSVNGEFAYREQGWKIVYRLPEENLQQSRGKPASVELYNLAHDIAETTDSAAHYPELVEELTNELQALVDGGSSKQFVNSANDVEVDFKTVQQRRWADEL